MSDDGRRSFVQLHLLTSYPPSNLNRDDLGRPKSAVMGGVERLRISSQSLKRAWRTSELFQSALDGHLGTRTRRLGREVLKKMNAEGFQGDKAIQVARKIAGVFGVLESEKKALVDIKQLAHISPREIQAVLSLASLVARDKRDPTDKELELLSKERTAVDVALFGRMLADKTEFNVEAAAQVAHAITVHQVAVEDDYFTAVDDLKQQSEDMGAGHIGESWFGAGLYYLYLCIDRLLLAKNLGGDADMAKKALRAIVEAAAKVSPRGKQSSFASRAYASYVSAEKGDQQPRSLSVAFLKPVRGSDLLGEAVRRFAETRQKMDAVYGPCADDALAVDVENACTSDAPEQGEHRKAATFAELLDFVVED